MQFHTRALSLIAVFSVTSAGLYAQFNFKLGGSPVQVHSFASQGFAYSNQNNYLTMKTTNGSFALTDFGFNVSTQLTDKLRIGAQLYDRNVGELGNFRPDLDWAYADYKARDWFGVRGGKVKTVVGLYSDTQDMTFLHTWAMMPASVYPIDTRGDTIAHIGADLYGNVDLHRYGSLSYTAYGGLRPNDPEGGFMYGLSTTSRVVNPDGSITFVVSQGKRMESYNGPTFGADLRWATPVKGLLVGGSYLNQDPTGKGTYTANNLPYRNITVRDHSTALYGEYSLGNLKLAGEYRRQLKAAEYNNQSGKLAGYDLDVRSGYVSAAYRINKWVEVGTYHSRFILDWKAYHGDPMNHIFDQALTARFDATSYLDLKVEGHFIDGNMINSALSRGFYAPVNPGGFKPDMNLLVVRLSYHM